jgi:hypothetical protein
MSAGAIAAANAVRSIAPPLSKDQITGFWHRVDMRAEDECWEWQGPRLPKGYGYLSARGRAGCEYAHRIAWEITNGAIPAGVFVLHHCDNPPCCNPAHLWLGTSGDNNRDAVRKGRQWKIAKTHCLRGHRYRPETTRLGSKGERLCLVCQRAYRRCRTAGVPDRIACVEQLVGGAS